MKISLLLLGLFLFPVFAKCQPVPLNGTVMDPRGHPLANVTVMLIRTGEVVISGKTGQFTFPDARATDSVRVSLAGYMSRTVINNERGRLEIILDPDHKELQEVIINSGYQEIPRERATGSFNHIDAKLLNEQISTTLLDRLPAVANGLTLDRVTGSPGFIIRGLSTVRGVRDPLIILNNFPYEGDLSNINPNDIESVTILKDAAAASIWGAKAGNGVIVINTKRGGFNQPVRVELNTAFVSTAEPDLHYLPMLGSRDYIDVERFLFQQQHAFSDTGNLNRPAFSPVYEILFRERRGEISHAEAEAMLQKIGETDLREEYLKHVYRKGLTRQHALQVSGGSQQNSWRFFGGYDNNTSGLADHYRRINLRAANNFRVSDRFTIRTDIVYTHSTADPGYAAFGSAPGNGKTYPIYTALKNEDGSDARVPYQYRLGYIDTAGQGRLLDWNYYPLREKDAVIDKSTTRHMLGNLALEYKIAGFRFSGQYQYERQVVDMPTRYTLESYYARNMINLFTELNPASLRPVHNFPKGEIMQLWQEAMLSQNIRGQLDYNRTHGRHMITALAGAEQRTNRRDYLTQEYLGFDPETYLDVIVDETSFYPTFVSGEYSNIMTQHSVGLLRNNFISYFANAAYNYDKRYGVSISGRRDASNMFGLKTNDKWTPLWSAGASWEISNEKFYTISWLPYLRWRGTIGYSGNTDPSRAAVTTFSFAPSSIVPSLHATMTQAGNPELRWERVKMLNLALDFGIPGNRLQGSVEYFQKHASDLFGPAQVDYTGGVGATITKNVGKMEVKGLDLELHSLNTTGIVAWSTDLNLNFNRDRLTEYYKASTQGQVTTTFPRQSGVKGKPVYSMYSYPFAGLDPLTGDPQGVIDGVVSKDYIRLLVLPQDQLVYHGPALPTVSGSIGNAISYKGFRLAVRLLGKFGHYFRRPTINYVDLYGRAITHTDYLLRWQQPGDEAFTNIPSRIYPGNARRDGFYNSSSATIERADHIRLQYINLTYQWMPSKRRHKIIQEMQVSVNANNLGLLWTATKTNIDPDFAINSIPDSRSFAFSLKAIF